ncbi:MAG: lamin tail domain-containing protein [Kiritimatiellae bacterium]|nr:lamin tail domain-containing protein [Kiritimatiellia bacterium]
MTKRQAICSCLLLPAVLAANAARGEILLPRASTWRYFKGTVEASDPRDAWRETDFDDSGWASGAAPLGYGETGVGTMFSDMQNSYTSFFIRKPFAVSAIGPESRLRVSVDYDDGFILWINGERVADRGEPDGSPLYNSLASADHESGTFETFEVSNPDDYLEVGPNLVAVQVFNIGPGSSDCKIDVELELYQKVADTTFSHDRGFYDSAFYVTIRTATPGATIRYTTDGSAPAATTGSVGGTNTVVHITTTTPLRAAAFKGGHEPTDVDTHTYLFLDAVLSQTRPSGYPSSTGINNSGVAFPSDYDMDATIVGDSAYRGMIKGAFQSVPTLSIVMKRTDLFGSLGLFTTNETVNSASVELIDPADPARGFQEDCGIEGHSWSRIKRSLRLNFQSQFGASKLRYPFFESAPLHSDSAAAEFDKLVLRGGGNMSFLSASQGAATTYTRDQWGRDSQIAMNGYGSHGTFVHLYLNGLYWGLYNPAERPDDHFCSTYWGGEPEDWFWAKSVRYIYDMVTGGDIARFNAWRNRTADGVTQADYLIIEDDELDVPAYGDYALLNLFNGVGDWVYKDPYKDAGNWFIGNRNNPPGKIRYFVWDAEDSWYWINGRSNAGAWINPNLTGTCTLKQFGDMWQSLIAYPPFKMIFADRVYRRCFNDGPLTTANCQSRWSTLCNHIEDAVVCESARWGDHIHDFSDGTKPVLKRNDHWYAARDTVATLMSTNVSTFIQLLRAQGWYPQIDPPTFQQHGGAIASGFRLTLSNPSGSTSVYYTLDGSDPRQPNGSLSPGAARYVGPITLSRTTHVRARVYKSNSTWSAAHEATFNYTAHYAKIRITEILYNPLGGSDFEFVEIKNTGSAARGLSEMIVKGIRYTFPPGTDLAPDDIALLVRNEAVFTNRYPGVKGSVAFFDVYPGTLDNGGERISLLDNAGLTVTAVRYNDKAPWPPTADGDGFSLVPTDTEGDQDDPAKWRASNLIGGSPGYDDGEPFRVVINEALTHTDLPQVDAIELRNAGATAAAIGGWYLSDSALDYKKFQIPGGTALPAGGYVVFDEGDFNANPGSPACFALDSHGDEIHLTKWDANGNLQYLAEARFGGAQNGMAFGRYIKSDGDADFVTQDTANTLGAANAAPKVGPVVINEILYHPAAGGDEFIELLNIHHSTVKLYDETNPSNTWRLSAAVDYAFPPGTELAPGEYALVVATNPATFRSTYGIPSAVQIFGPYTGALNNAGESVKLWRPDTPDLEGVPWILVDRVKYGDNSPWPENADGDGPSLERQDARAYGNDVVNWAASLAAGGTPGAPNSGGLVSKTAGWKYHDGGVDLGTAWRAAGHDDSAWQDGNAPLGYPATNPDIDTVVSYGDNPAAKQPTTYFRRTFTLGVEPAAVTNLALLACYDDGFVAYLNGQEVARAGMPAGTIAYTTLAAVNNGSQGFYESVDLAAHVAKLQKGLNVLAVEVHQAGADSSDLFIDVEIAYAAQTVQLDIPAPPSGLQATATSQSRIDLTWQDNSDNEDGFKVDRRQTGASEWIAVATPGANTSTLSDSGLPAGTYFYYKIKAYNADGNSDYSNIAGDTTYEGPPAAPSGLGATPASTTRIDLGWTDNSGNEDGFKIERKPTSGSTWAQIATVGANISTHSDNALTPGTSYDYRVRAYNASGHSAYSATATATTALPAVQFAAAASAGSESASPVSLAVTLSSASSQTVTVQYATTGGSATGKGTDYTLTAGTLTFSPGQTSKDIALTVVDDDAEEGDETIVATLSNPSNATLGTRSAHTYTIQDNDTLFIAYNDLAWKSGQLSLNITRYSNIDTTSGALIDYATGETAPVSVSITGGGSVEEWLPTNPAEGTDAHTVFNGIVDCDTHIGYSATPLHMTFTGMDPSLTYEFVFYCNRGNEAYTNRTATVTLSDVDGFSNTSTPGATITGVQDDSTILPAGYNTLSGYVARFSQIEPGPDGDMLVTVSDNDSKFYANAFMLRGTSPAEPPPTATGIAANSVWRYRKGTAEAADPAGAWREIGFDDSAWLTGAGAFGFADGPYGTVLGDMQNSYSCVFLRSAFTIPHPALVSELQLWALHDDGFIMWINGQEVARVHVDGAPGSFIPYDSFASVWCEPTNWTATLAGADMPGLVAGTNVLAVQGFNLSIESDFTIDAALAVTLSQLSVAEDADRDGIPDAWEQEQLGGNAAYDGDSDGDGLSNLDEFIAGTDPDLAGSLFAVDLTIAGTDLVVSFPTVQAAGTGYAGFSRHYALEARAGMDTGFWAALPGYENITGAGQTVACTNSPAASATCYRGRVWLE